MVKLDKLHVIYIELKKQSVYKLQKLNMKFLNFFEHLNFY